MAKAVPQSTDETIKPFGSDLYFIAVPLETYRELSRVATSRGLTFAQALGTAIANFLKEK